MIKSNLLFIFLFTTTCYCNNIVLDEKLNKHTNKIIVGAERVHDYKSSIVNKNIAIVANHTSMVRNIKSNYTHLVDSLINSKIKVKKIFTPEHGYKGSKPNGANIDDSVDDQTGLEIISLHGKNRKYGEILDTDIKNIDLIIFDIQDVGVRFYTHISTLHYVMKACAKNNIPLIVLDRPNPNIHYVDGPVLNLKNQSFVGMHKVPIVYGMTIGEYSLMINGEGWLGDNLRCDLSVIKLKNYDRKSTYDLPIKPSPNLPTTQSINYYPSLCLFEGTNVSVGRGTEKQFIIYGSPYLDKKVFNYEFTPYPNSGSINPKHKEIKCYGEEISKDNYFNKIELKYLINAYKLSSNKNDFFNSFFIKLAGISSLKEQIISGISEKKIRLTWQKDLTEFKLIRAKYLLY